MRRIVCSPHILPRVSVKCVATPLRATTLITYPQQVHPPRHWTAQAAQLKFGLTPTPITFCIFSQSKNYSTEWSYLRASWWRNSGLAGEVVLKVLRPDSIPSNISWNLLEMQIISSFLPSLLNERLCSWDNGVCVLTNSPGRYDACPCLRSTLQRELLPHLYSTERTN